MILKRLELVSGFAYAMSMGLVAFFAVGILNTYLHYLNFNPLALIPDYYNVVLSHVKLVIFLWGTLVVLLSLRDFRKRLTANGYNIRRKVMVRSIMWSLIFCISLAGYDPSDIDLTFYFFVHIMAYAMLLFVFTRFVCIDRLCSFIGVYVLRLFKTRDHYWPLAAFIFVFLMAYHMSWMLFQHFPWIDDTIVQLVHAKFILEGHLYAASPPLPQFFQMAMMINDGKWYSHYPPGHVFLLAIGLAFQHPEMVNPFLGAATCITVWLLAKEIYGAHVAKVAALLSALCTYIIIFSSEYMNNATSLLMCTLFLWAYVCLLKRPRWYFGVIAGFALGYCFITRPYTAAAFALPAAFYGMYLGLRKPRTYLLPMFLIAAVFICFAAFQLYYNSITTGDPFVFGYQKTHGDIHNPFTTDAFEKMSTKKVLYRSLGRNLQRLVYFNRILFEWPLPVMGLVAFVFALRGKRHDERLLLFTIISMMLSVQFIIHTDAGWGPRLLYEINGIFLILCAKGLCMLPPFLRCLYKRSLPLRDYYGAGLVILASFYVVAFQYNLKLATIKDFYWFHNREGNPTFYKTIVRNVHDTPALVFIPGDVYKFVSFTNPPRQNTPIVFAIDMGDDNKQLMAMAGNRHIYVVYHKDTGGYTMTKIR